MKMKAAPFAVLLLALLGTCHGQLLSLVTRQDVDDFLSDQDMVMQQINCVLDVDECDFIGDALKAAVPEFLVNKCRSCSPQESDNVNHVINILSQQYPNEWAKIRNKFLPRG